MKDTTSFKPGTKEAWLNGCRGCRGDKHSEGCVFWDGSKPDVVGDIIVGSVRVSSVPVGVKFHKTTTTALIVGDVFITESNYKHLCGAGFIDGTWIGFGGGSYTLNIATTPKTMRNCDVWKMELVY